jgi:hypothetical protein
MLATIEAEEAEDEEEEDDDEEEERRSNAALAGCEGVPAPALVVHDVTRRRNGRPFHLLQGDGIEEPGQRVLVLPGLLVLLV